MQHSPWEENDSGDGSGIGLLPADDPRTIGSGGLIRWGTLLVGMCVGGGLSLVIGMAVIDIMRGSLSPWASVAVGLTTVCGGPIVGFLEADFILSLDEKIS